MEEADREDGSDRPSVERPFRETPVVSHSADMTVYIPQTPSFINEV